MFRWVSRESFEGKISGDKFSTVSACWGLFANAMLATSGNNAFSPLNIIYFTLPWLRKGKISKGSEIAQDMNTVFASGKLFTELWWVSRILEEGSQEKRLKLNKGLWEKVTVADASLDQKVFPASYKKYHKWFLEQQEDQQKQRTFIYLFSFNNKAENILKNTARFLPEFFIPDFFYI